MQGMFGHNIISSKGASHHPKQKVSTLLYLFLEGNKSKSFCLSCLRGLNHTTSQRSWIPGWRSVVDGPPIGLVRTCFFGLGLLIRVFFVVGCSFFFRWGSFVKQF